MTARKRPLLVPLLALAVLASPVTGLERIGGRLVDTAGSVLEPGDETLGWFELEAASPGADVRLDPGRLVVQTARGRLEARALRAFGPRNVDPATGRPLVLGGEGTCSGNVFGGVGGIPGPASPDPDCLTPLNVLEQHSVNQTLFHLVCASSIGFSSLDRSVCSQTVFGSTVNVISATPADPAVAPTLGAFLANLLGGNAGAGNVGDALAPGISGLVVPLNADPCDGLLSDCLTAADTGSGIDQGNAFFGSLAPTLNSVLTQQQRALLGCGEFYGTNCELDGIDLLNADASVLFQAWPDPTGGLVATDDPGVVQPGTVGFVPFRGLVATRDLGGVLVTLPGARGPNDPADALDDSGVPATLATGDNGWLYDPRTGGCTTPLSAVSRITAIGDCAAASPLQHPFTGQTFANELAVVSWNALMLTVAFSFADDPDNVGVDEFDPGSPFRSDGCSFARPVFCSTLAQFWATTSRPLSDDPLGDAVRWAWENGAEFEVEVATGEFAALLGQKLETVGPEIARLGLEGVGLAVSGEALGLYGIASACGNGQDDDGDGLVDLDDPGCPSLFAEPEDPLCDDGLDNDGDGLTDFDDPGCRSDFPYAEYPGCGLGAEAALALLPWAAWRRHRSRRRDFSGRA